ncbi:hypothetical protein B0H14DRAFT_2619119 [Mycena olivaceomarginata]|nr:hypothetical protein B0H14DRAFT_2619119 [Mycena olivaceomarginata]
MAGAFSHPELREKNRLSMQRRKYMSNSTSILIIDPIMNSVLALAIVSWCRAEAKARRRQWDPMGTEGTICVRAAQSLLNDLGRVSESVLAKLIALVIPIKCALALVQVSVLVKEG